MKKSLLSLVMVFALFSCKPTHERVIDKLNSERQLFDDFAIAAYQDETLRANKEKLITPDQLKKSTQEKLVDLGLERVSYIILGECEQAGEYSLEIIFEGDWHLEYYSCGRPHYIPRGYDEKDLIECWGIDDQWFLWVNNDFIG